MAPRTSVPTFLLTSFLSGGPMGSTADRPQAPAERHIARAALSAAAQQGRHEYGV